MYATCIFCHGSLGQNEIVEAFPVGRRLAFDPERGRLWAVCARCGRWNLSPIEERWEALEELERRFRATPLRASTEHVGLAKLGEGLELIRIGRPARPEFAAWRYGGQFRRRRVRQVAIVAVTTVAVGAVVLGAAEVGAAVTGAGVLIQAGLRGARHWWRDQRVAARVDLPDGRRVALALQHTARAELHADAANGWRLDVPYLGVGTRVVEGFTGRRHVADVAQLTGDHARRAMSVILPSLNPWGGGERRVQDAVTLLDRAGTSPTDYFGIVARVPRTKPRTNYGFTDSTLPLLRTLPPAVRLALEMASHEESERRALDGELAVLETAWREAEEIAAIADDMFLPASVTAWLDRPHARRNAGPRE